MKVEVLNATENPLSLCGFAAGVCYGKRDYKASRALGCMRRNHMSVMEHCSATFLVEGVSRALMAQITRHRLASFCVESQRYCEACFDGDWYVTPPGMEDSKVFHLHMIDAARRYRSLVETGTKPEDARFVLPEAAKTDMVVTMNGRELLHFLEMRLDKAAQWEIRALANGMVDALCQLEEWGDLLAAIER